MATKERLEQALRNADKAGDVTAAKRFAAAIRNGEYDQSVTSQLDVPVNAPGEQSQYIPDQPQQPEPSFIDKGVAGAKAFGVMAGNLIPATVGSIGGTVYGLGKELAGAPTGSGADEVVRGAQALSPFSTNDPLANQYIQNTGEALGSLDPGFVGGIVRGSIVAAPAARQAREIAGQAPAVAQEAVRDIQSFGRSPLEVAQSQTDLVKSQIEAGKTTNNLAAKTIENGKVVDNPYAKKVIDQGFDEGFVSAIQAASPKTKQQIAKMVRVSELGSKDKRFAAENRPSDIIGDSLAERVTTMNRINKEAAGEIDQVAEKVIKGKPVDYEPSFDIFMEDLKKTGISENDNGSLNFSGSDLEFSPGDKRLISNIYSRAKSLDGSDAYRVHKLKRLIDTTVNYGKGSQSGITSGGESIVKRFRAAVDSELDNAFPEYNAANTKYADSIGELTSIQEAVGPSINVFGDNADKALGTKSRTLLSNTQNRVKLMDSLKSLDETARKYGANFDDDIITQVMVANELDNHFGASAKTSLRGDLEGAAGNAVEQSLRGGATMSGLGMETAKAVKNKIKGRNAENSYKALKELLRNQQQ